MASFCQSFKVKKKEKKNYDRLIFKFKLDNNVVVVLGELLRLPHTLAIGSTTGRKNVTICTACKILVKGVFKAVDAGKSDDQISNEIGQLCNTVKLYSSKVCSGVASIAMPTIRYIYQSGKVIRGNICGMVLQDENCPIKNVDSLEWTVEPSKVTKPLFTPFIAPPVYIFF